MNPHHIGNAFHIQRRGLKMTVDDLNKAFADILFPIRRTGGILTAFDRPYREIMKKNSTTYGNIVVFHIIAFLL